ncbi:helix-turn-helix domain-containing protein [Arsenicicoccus piscis]|uniref:helix-turn-helix domain-containing protein n=1 Tax=Arsenicicoccus piscis TaxID=673954 RepID=UPI0024E14834|nr:helix-turn-helix domain-containing protein [Arsenicicoccus piscis]
MLQARVEWPGAELAERLDVSVRTLRRDVDTLRDLGYPVNAIKGLAAATGSAPGEAASARPGRRPGHRHRARPADRPGHGHRHRRRGRARPRHRAPGHAGTPPGRERGVRGHLAAQLLGVLRTADRRRDAADHRSGHPHQPRPALRRHRPGRSRPRA